VPLKLRRGWSEPPRPSHHWVFSQGTTTNGKQLIIFKTGAFATGRPVQPVLLKFPFRNFSPAYTNCSGLWHFYRHMTQVCAASTLTPARRTPNNRIRCSLLALQAACWRAVAGSRGRPRDWVLWRACGGGVWAQLVNWAEVVVMPVYEPSAAELADSTLYMRNVRQLMAGELGVPLVEQGLEELHALSKARIQVAWDGRTVLGDVDRLPQLIAEARQKRLDKAQAETFRAEEGNAAGGEENPNEKLLLNSSPEHYNTF
jgi:hypothetical protein